SELEALDRNPCIHEQDLERQDRPGWRVAGWPETGKQARHAQQEAKEVDGPDAREPGPVEASDGAPVRQFRIPVPQDEAGENEEIGHGLPEIEPGRQRIPEGRAMKNEYGEGGYEARAG